MTAARATKPPCLSCARDARPHGTECHGCAKRRRLGRPPRLDLSALSPLPTPRVLAVLRVLARQGIDPTTARKVAADVARITDTDTDTAPTREAAECRLLHDHDGDPEGCPDDGLEPYLECDCFVAADGLDDAGCPDGLVRCSHCNIGWLPRDARTVETVAVAEGRL